VKYRKVGKENSSVTMVTVNATSLSVPIVELDKFSEYRIMISGLTSKGDGNQSEIMCWTDEDGKCWAQILESILKNVA